MGVNGISQSTLRFTGNKGAIAAIIRTHDLHCHPFSGYILLKKTGLIIAYFFTSLTERRSNHEPT
jgi:hypothetical protein